MFRPLETISLRRAVEKKGHNNEHDQYLRKESPLFEKDKSPLIWKSKIRQKLSRPMNWSLNSITYIPLSFYSTIHPKVPLASILKRNL